jgi:hypothetical protein
MNNHKPGTKAYARREAQLAKQAKREADQLAKDALRKATLSRAAALFVSPPSKLSEWGAVRVRAWVFFADKVRRLYCREKLGHAGVLKLSSLLDAIDDIDTATVDVVWGRMLKEGAKE